MEEHLHLLLERWEDHRRDHPGSALEEFLAKIETEEDRDTIQRFQAIAKKLESIDRQLTQIGVGRRDSS